MLVCLFVCLLVCVCLFAVVFFCFFTFSMSGTICVCLGLLGKQEAYILPQGILPQGILPLHCGPLIGLTPNSSTLCPFGFQSKLASSSSLLSEDPSGKQCLSKSTPLKDVQFILFVVKISKSNLHD